MDCQKGCEKLTGTYKEDLKVCGKCKDVKKIDLVRIINGMARIYISDDNIGKNPPKLGATEKHDIKHAYMRHEKSVSKLAKEYNVSDTTIRNVIKDPSVIFMG